MLEPTPTTSHDSQPVGPTVVYCDTSFLINLISTTRPRAAFRRVAPPKQLDHIVQRQLEAITWFSELQAKPDGVAYCSPVVIQELFWACVSALLWRYASDVGQGIKSELTTEIDRVLPESLRDAAHEHQNEKTYPTDVVKGCLPYLTNLIRGKLTPLLADLKIVSDGWTDSGRWLDEFASLLATGELRANDCVLVLTASAVKAEALFTDDDDFRRARKVVERYVIVHAQKK